MAEVPHAPGFSADVMGSALTERVRKPDGSAYAAFAQFAPWKRWGDTLRDYVEAVRIGLRDQKVHLDAVDDREHQHYLSQQTINAELRAQLQNLPFP